MRTVLIVSAFAFQFISLPILWRSCMHMLAKNHAAGLAAFGWAAVFSALGNLCAYIVLNSRLSFIIAVTMAILGIVSLRIEKMISPKR